MTTAMSAVPHSAEFGASTVARRAAAVPLTGYALIGAVAVALFAIRLTGLPNLMDNEYRVGACVLDVLQHGNWLCPHDSLGNTDKPPMLTWLAALASFPLGRVTPFTLYLPSALATLAIAWLVAAAGARHFGARAGFFAGVAYLLSDVGARQVATARWDGIFALGVTIAALLAFRSWTEGGGWAWFWLAAAGATLTKGPLGVLLAAFGLLAIFWERRSGHPTRLAGSHLLGVALYLLFTVGWFVLAYRRVGPHLVTNMIGDEFVGNMTEHQVGYRFWKPPGDFLANFAPWSVFTLFALYRAVTGPAPADDARRFERFLSCWFAGGLLLFCISPHNQSRLMYPMIPGAALLAGRELDRTATRAPHRIVTALVGFAIVAALVVFYADYHRFRIREAGVRETLAFERLATRVRATLGDDVPLTYVDDTPFAFQLLLNTMRPSVSYEAAAALLRGDTAAVVAVANGPRLRRIVGPGSTLHDLGEAVDGGTTYLHLLANRATLDPEEATAVGVGSLIVTLHAVHLGPTWNDEIVLHRGPHPGKAAIDNATGEARTVTVQVGTSPSASSILAPGAQWRIEVP
jgi:dolichyl-phosphate-mannose-protein mannosyltransferase